MFERQTVFKILELVAEGGKKKFTPAQFSFKVPSKEGKDGQRGGHLSNHPLNQHLWCFCIYSLSLPDFNTIFYPGETSPSSLETHLLTVFLQDRIQTSSLNSLCLFSLQAGFCLSWGPEAANVTSAHLQHPNKILQGNFGTQSRVFWLTSHSGSAQNYFCERLDAPVVLETGASVNAGVSWLCPKLLECQLPQEEIPTDPACHSWTWVRKKPSPHLLQPMKQLPQPPSGSPQATKHRVLSLPIFTIANQPSGSWKGLSLRPLKQDLRSQAAKISHLQKNLCLKCYFSW